MRIGIDIGSDSVKLAVLEREGAVRHLASFSGRGRPLRAALEALQDAQERTGEADGVVGLSGSGAEPVGRLLGLQPLEDSVALVQALNRFHPEVRTVVDMGRETQRYLLLEPDPATGRLVMIDSGLAGKCAAGTGSFIDHICRRLNYPSIEEFARVACQTDQPAALSGRCGVFTESDIVHLYQKGTPRERIAAGVHHAVVRTYTSSAAKAKEFVPPVAFVGGVARNPAVLKFLIRELELEPGQVFVPENAAHLVAIGAALHATKTLDLGEAVAALERQIAKPLEYRGAERLRLERSEFLQPPAEEPRSNDIELAALGVDIGSVSTKAALVTEEDGRCIVLASYYRRTNGDPLMAVCDTVAQIHRQIQEKGYRMARVVAGTTGSGRYLTGDYVGADVVKNEITAQAAGTLAFMQDVDAIFEIGGQDSKFVRLSGPVIVDFEMNKACAAGTGAFLEKQAAQLGVEIDQFGELALEGAHPPALDWTCTVFSESAMLSYQQANVPVPDLCAAVCLAAAKNYLNKNVGNRDTGKRAAFQGAVAFNKGMVAAFETLLGRKIVVPPYPHLTGAIGAARLALREAGADSRFRGFEQIARGAYRVSSFECKGCPNHCDVNCFELEGGGKYYYNDRCERYSAKDKRRRESALPDLFAEREQFLWQAYQPTPGRKGPRVGVPRGLLFNDYFPFFHAFLSELGCEVVVSDQTNKQIVKWGVEATLGEPCFPLKVAHGHVVDLVEKGVDCIFAPAVMEAGGADGRYPRSQTCPYLQSAPDVMGTALRLRRRECKMLVPRLFLDRGPRHLYRALRHVAEELGLPVSRVRPAVQAGLEALGRFHQLVQARGRQVLEEVGPDQMAFVVIARPYALYDAALNMDISRKVRDLSILPVPMDFLPLDEEDVSDNWSNLYARQIQRKLAAARAVRRDARFRAVVLTYFGCGPDSFANQFFKDEIGEPCYVMQIDEHTADAGVITRIEAFADTAVSRTKAAPPLRYDTEDSPLEGIRGRQLWIPYAGTASTVLAALFRAYDIDAEVLPSSPDEGLNLARQHIPEDVCLPAFITSEDILHRVTQPDFDPEREAFFQGKSEGPCRYGMYFMLQRRLLERLGFGQVPIFTLGNRDHEGGLGRSVSLVAWDSMVAHDLLQKMALRTRPYELNPGESDGLFCRFLGELCALAKQQRGVLESRGGTWLALRGRHLEALTDLLHRAQRAFAEAPTSGEAKPLVGVVGEFYVRIHPGANHDIIRNLEAAGVEVWLAPATEFLAYSTYITGYLAQHRWRDVLAACDLKEALRRRFLTGLAVRDEHILFDAAADLLGDRADIGPREVVELGSLYVHPTFGGEAICSLGKAEDFARRGLEGIVSVVPFNCMPGMTVRALSQELSRRHGHVPFISIEYDGFTDRSRQVRLSAFVAQVQERFAVRAQAPQRSR